MTTTTTCSGNHALAPLAPPWTAETAEVLAAYPQRDGQLIGLFRVFANSLRFLRKGVANLLDRDSPLPLRLREIVILRITANNNCEYEWGVHVAAFGRAAKLDEAQVRATRLGDSSAPCWSAEERLLLRAVDALCLSGRMDDTLCRDFQNTWNVAEQLEILALCGNYHTVSFVANTATLPLEPFAVRFPDP